MPDGPQNMPRGRLDRRRMTKPDDWQIMTPARADERLTRADERGARADEWLTKADERGERRGVSLLEQLQYLSI